jgi:hypothetical protein
MGAIQAHAQHRRGSDDLAGSVGAKPAYRLEADLEKPIGIG